MGFESKYLIRWGIPGWVFIFFIFGGLISNAEYDFKGVNLPEMSTSITLLLSLAAIGVPLGYVFHQLYFGFSLVVRNFEKLSEVKKEIGEDFPAEDDFGTVMSNLTNDYYHLEYVWHSMLLEQDENTRIYLEERYRHILGTTHALGALWMSTICSIYTNFFISFLFIGVIESNEFYISILVVQILILFSSFFNYLYFSKNLRAFQIKMLKRYLPLEKA